MLYSIGILDVHNVLWQQYQRYPLQSAWFWIALVVEEGGRLRLGMR
jgi:hypothetical protein